MDINTIQNHWKLFLFEGILLVILGLLAVALPVISTLSIEILIGVLLVIGGIATTVRTLQVQAETGFYMTLFNSTVAIIVGLLLLFFPQTGVLTLTLLLGFFFLIEGIIKIIAGLQLGPATNRVWLIISGFLALIISVVIFSGLPGTAAWALGLLVGINMVFGGWSLIALALTARMR